MPPEQPVLIAGGGPVGLCLALALRRQGTDVVLLEQRPLIGDDHRATTIQPPVLELLERWGVLRTVLSVGRRVDTLQYWDWTAPTLLASFDYGLIADDARCPYRVHIAQSELCRILRGFIEHSWPGTLRFGHRVRSFVDEGDRVVATVEAAEGDTYRSRGRLLVAADGAHSEIRQTVGIALVGTGPTHTFLSSEGSLEVIAALRHRIGGRPLAGVSYLYLDDRWVLVMAMADAVRVLYAALPGEDGPEAWTRAAQERHLRGLIGRDSSVRLHGLSVYRVQQRVADRYREGRVVLAGDSAHSVYPVGGTAMNAGILDAGALASAIGQGDAALDPYAEVRRRCVSERTLETASSAYAELAGRGRWNRAARARQMARIALDPEAARAHLLRLSMLPVERVQPQERP